MKTNKKAFPYYESNAYAGQVILGDKGMSLRDYFANSAMQGLLVNIGRNDYKNNIKGIEILAEDCYKIADAMLKQRELNND
jgi:hypothetical protein